MKQTRRFEKIAGKRRGFVLFLASHSHNCQPLFLDNIIPSPRVREFVRLYRIVDFMFTDNHPIPSKAYTPQAEECLQFYPKDTETVRYPDNRTEIGKINTSLVGQHTVVNHRQVGKNFLTFQVVFQPGALFRITGIPSQELVNQYLDATVIFGKDIQQINEQLYLAGSHAAMTAIVEDYLFTRICIARKTASRIDPVCQQMLLETEPAPLDWYIRESCLSHRQFDRHFKDRTGISPKQWLRVIRFDKARRMKNQFPNKDWLSIALHSGYYDYQHLVKDYHAFTGMGPTEFLALENRAPERLFGVAEV